MEQQNSRDDVFGHTLSGGPAHGLSMKIDPETVRHAPEHIPPADKMHHEAKARRPARPEAER
jgi:hypothetical protein